MTSRWLALLATALGAAVITTQAATFRWSSQGDFLSADPHAYNEALTNSFNSQVYESLVVRGKRSELVAGLATSWERDGPNRWVFNLRKGVRFHDGSEFTADDVVFTIRRAQGETSSFKLFANGVGEPRKLDANTLELITPAPNPVMLEMLSTLLVMSRAWCEKNNAVRAQDFTREKEAFTARNAMGTGPFVLVSRDPDVKSVFRKNPDWWGLAEPGRFDGNVETMIYVPVKEGSTRMAALLSGDLDLVLDPPVQDIERLRQVQGLRLHEGPENRVVFLGFDQARDELLYSSVKGRNPFKDRRVRQAVYQAIDVESIRRTVMRGLSRPTATTLPDPAIAALPPEMGRRRPFDPAASRRLLAEAGYPGGFDVTIDCPNNRYINDEKICVAVAAMLARVGVTARVNALPRAQYFPKGQRLETSMYLLGWGGPNTDPLFTLLPVLHSRNDKGDGDFNWGNYRDLELDVLIDQARVEMEVGKRHDLVVRALRRHDDMVFHVPLHLQVIPWAARANVEAVHRPDNWLRATWVKVN